MRLSTVPLLRSPDSGHLLRVEIFRQVAQDGEVRIVEGALFDDSTDSVFRIEDEIADLSPLALRDHDADTAFAMRHGLKAPIPSREKPDRNALEQRKFFGEEHDRYESEVVQSPFSQVLDTETLGRWTRRSFSEPARIAEIGAGSGRQTVILAEQGHHVLSIDLSVEMLRLASVRLRKAGLDRQVDLIVGIGEAPPLADAAFDAWVIMGSLHHFSEPAAAVDKCSRLLRPGGRQFLLEPHRSPVRPVFDWLMKRSQLWHEEANEDPLFTFAKFQHWLDKAGIDTKIYTSTFLPPHLFYVLPKSQARGVLRWSDRIFGHLPLAQRLGGIIIAEGVKRS